ncbi:hypothetical protein JCM8547_001279 [Rhodosporidiobolus lusitaniae]
MPSSSSISTGSHNLTPPSSTVSHERSDSQHYGNKLGEKVDGVVTEARGKVTGDKGKVEEGRRERQGAGMRKEQD